jgi:anti-anti-sigma factor
MELTFSTKENAGFITLIGQLWQKEDLDAVENTVNQLVKEKIVTVVLDIDRLSFMNSAGLGLLARIHARLKDAGGKMILFNPHASICEIIEISGFDLFMKIVKTKEELSSELK